MNYYYITITSFNDKLLGCFSIQAYLDNEPPGIAGRSGDLDVTTDLLPLGHRDHIFEVEDSLLPVSGLAARTSGE